MKWEKLGLIFNVENQFDWMCSHASLPIAQILNGDIFRIYFSTRDSNNRSNGAYIDIDILNPFEIINISEQPVLLPGDIGLFDDSGVSLSSFCNGKLFYLGWNLPKNVPFSNQIGSAIFEDSGIYKNRRMPLLPKCEKEPFSFGYPWVMYHKGKYKMWYDVIVKWTRNSPDSYISKLRLAESQDGINWDKTYIDCVLLQFEEKCISRPCIIYENEIFKIWYSINLNEKYSIGYAESLNGIDWQRKDQEVGKEKKKIGWDSEQIEYPYVFDHKDDRYMLYNGNGYGRTGFGLAKLQKQELL